MSFAQLTEAHELFRVQIRRFVEEKIRPHGEAWEEAGQVPRELLREMGALGFLGLRYAEEYGGAGADPLMSVMLAEELGRSSFGGVTATVLVHTDMASPHLVNAGSKAQRDKYLKKVIAGELVTVIGVTEPDAGSDVAGMRATARKVDGGYVLNGAKMFITNGVYGDLYFIGAKTDPAAKGSRGISIFIVEKGMPGFKVGRKLRKMGWLCSDTAELIFEDCFVPAENLLGEENKGFYAIMKNFQNERLVLSAMAVGESLKALELTLDYVKDRKAFGGVLFDKQAIRQRLSMRWAQVEAARQFVYHVGWKYGQGMDCVKEVSMLKALCGELVNDVMYDCQQFHGGFGYIRESAIERMARDARILPIGGGASEVMLEEVAKRL